jgi:hypothetical protein
VSFQTRTATWYWPSGELHFVLDLGGRARGETELGLANQGSSPANLDLDSSHGRCVIDGVDERDAAGDLAQHEEPQRAESKEEQKPEGDLHSPSPSPPASALPRRFTRTFTGGVGSPSEALSRISAWISTVMFSSDLMISLRKVSESRRRRSS